MKKLILIFLLAALIAAPLAALDLSAGGDFGFTHRWTPAKTTFGNYWSKETESGNYLGFNGFFDAKYIRAYLGVNFLVGGLKEKESNSFGASSTATDSKFSLTNFHLSALAKYPFNIGRLAKIYPLLGFEFDFNISAKYDGKDMKPSIPDKYKKDLNSYYFVLGAGADIFVAGNLFIAPKAIFGVDIKQKEALKDATSVPGVKVHGGHALKFDIGLGVGYKF